MRDLFRRYAAGEPLAAILAELRDGGMRLSDTRACELLRHPLYVGRVPLADGGTASALAEPIVSEPVWRAVQDRLAAARLAVEPTVGIAPRRRSRRSCAARAARR